MTTSSNHRPTSVRSQLTKLVHVQFRQFICWPTKSTDFSCHMANFCQPMTKNRSSDIGFSGRVELNGESYLPWSRLQRRRNYDMPILLWLAKWHWWKFCLNHRWKQYGLQSSRLTAEDLLCILWISASLWLREVPWLMWWMTQHSILPFWYGGWTLPICFWDTVLTPPTAVTKVTTLFSVQQCSDVQTFLNNSLEN